MGRLRKRRPLGTINKGDTKMTSYMIAECRERRKKRVLEADVIRKEECRVSKLKNEAQEAAFELEKIKRKEWAKKALYEAMLEVFEAELCLRGEDSDLTDNALVNMADNLAENETNRFVRLVENTKF